MYADKISTISPLSMSFKQKLGIGVLKLPSDITDYKKSLQKVCRICLPVYFCKHLMLNGKHSASTFLQQQICSERIFFQKTRKETMIHVQHMCKIFTDINHTISANCKHDSCWLCMVWLCLCNSKHLVKVREKLQSWKKSMLTMGQDLFTF